MYIRVYLNGFDDIRSSSMPSRFVIESIKSLNLDDDTSASDKFINDHRRGFFFFSTSDLL